MGIATPASHLYHHPLQQQPHHISQHHRRPQDSDAMSHHNYHHGFLGFPPDDNEDDDRGGGMDHHAQPLGAESSSVYDPTAASSILSEMLNFAGTGPSATELLASQFTGNWYAPPPPPPQQPAAAATDHAMTLFLMNPPPAPPPQPFSGSGQGLSLSLSSSLQQLEAAAAAAASNKPDELFFRPPQQFQVDGGQAVQLPAAATLRQSRYARAAQELLEEFCSVGRGQLKRPRRGPNANPNPNSSSSSHAAAGAGGGGGSSSSSKDPAPPLLTATDRFEHQRKKSKLTSMLDEVERRYNHYCDQMQMVVNSFDGVMGYGAAVPYTGLARKAMSRHFRCLKDAIVGQLRKTCEVLGEKEGAAVTGITKGETPRLKMLDQSLRQQRAFNQMGMMEQEAWRPQRGLPERSVNILRAWLFEHFLHPYPNDADKHMLARQTGLSRNQVTNWFINARVRLWKPMVEEMYQQEARDDDEDDDERDAGDGSSQGGLRSESPREDPYAQAKRSKMGVTVESEPTSSTSQQQLLLQQQQYHHLRFQPSSSENHLGGGGGGGGSFLPTVPGVEFPSEFLGLDGNVLANYESRMVGQGAQVRYGATGDVSLTLGLQHAGNAPENNRFTFRDFAGGGGGGGAL